MNDEKKEESFAHHLDMAKRNLDSLPDWTNSLAEYTKSALEKAEKKIADLEAKNEKLRASLLKYGHHLGGCNYYKRIPYGDKERAAWKHCTCGYTE